MTQVQVSLLRTKDTTSWNEKIPMQSDESHILLRNEQGEWVIRLHDRSIRTQDHPARRFADRTLIREEIPWQAPSST